jgi:hypothetical protein
MSGNQANGSLCGKLSKDQKEKIKKKLRATKTNDELRLKVSSFLL